MIADQLLFVPITKVDEATRQVWGRATQEIPDSAGEVMDYASSAPYFRAWSEATIKRSGGKSKGNLREMHGAKAAGKLIAIQFNDQEKAVDVGTQIVDDAAWEKVMQGVYTGFSVGGKYARRWSDPNNYNMIRYTASPQELSLVDAPAVPTATYSLVKADGSTEMRKFKNVLPLDVPVQEMQTGEVEALVGPKTDLVVSDVVGRHSEPLEVPTEGADEAAGLVPVQAVELEAAIDEATDDTPFLHEVVTQSSTVKPITPGSPESTDPAAHGVQPAPVAGADVVQLNKFLEGFGALISRLEALQKADADQKDKVVNDLTERGKRVGIARREGEPLTPPKDYPTDPALYADPANWAFPCDSTARCTSAIAYFNGGAGRSKYSPGEWNILGRRIATMAGKAFDAPYQYSPKDKKIERMAKMKAQYDLTKAGGLADLMSDARSQMSSAASLISSDPQKAQEMLDQVSAAMSIAGDVSKADGAPAAVAPAAPALSAEEIEKAKAAPAASTGASGNTTPGTTPPGSTGDSDDTATVKKAIADLTATVAGLAAVVEKMNVATAGTPAQGHMAADPNVKDPPMGKADGQPTNTPVGDLAAQVQPGPANDQYANLEKALTTGDPRTQYLEALKVANGDQGVLDSAVYDMVKRRFHDGGVVSSDRIKVFTPQGLQQ